MTDRRFKPIRHGTQSGYTRGCRCDECVEVHRDYNREYQRRRRALAGKPWRQQTPQERRQQLYEVERERIRVGRSARVTAYMGRA